MSAANRFITFQPLNPTRVGVGAAAGLSRAQRIGLLLGLLAVLNMVDLYCTLFAYRLGMLHELNPIAAAFLVTGLEPSFICYKLVMLLAGSMMLWKLRSSGWTLPACWILVAAYAWLAVIWYRWMQEVAPVFEAATHYRR